MAVTPGFADVSLQVSSTIMSRPSFVTFGVDPSSSTPDSIAQSVYTAATSAGSLISKVDSGCTIGPTTIRLGQDGGEALVGYWSLRANGAISLTSPPPNVAVLIHKRTARGGRRGRGRLFMPWFVDETTIDEAGIIAPATVTSLATCVEVFRTALATNGVPMVVLHEPGKTTAGAPDVVTSLTVDPLVATQRRRLGR
jgi:hypothetical protein